MFKSMPVPLKTVIILLLAITFFAPPVEARLMAGGPDTVIANSPLILTGVVTKNLETEEERSFTVKINHVLKGDYQKEEIMLSEKINPVYGWVHIRSVPEMNTELLLFLRNEVNNEPYFSFDLNCIALVEGEEVTALLGGSNVGINDERWEIEDYVSAYNTFFNNADPVETQATQNGSSLALVGGADGPTEVHISGDPLKAIIVPAIILAVILFAAGFAIGYAVKGKKHT